MKLLLTGSVALDRIMIFPGKFSEVIQPDKLHVLSVSVLLDKLKETWGGTAANIAYSLALLGEKPILLSAVGESARRYIKSLEKLGVDTSQVYFSDLPTATFTVLTDKMDNQVGGFYIGAMGDADSLSVERFADKEVLVTISAHDPAAMRRQVKECVSLKKRLFYDPGQQVSNISGEDIKAGVEAAELLILNDYEMGVVEKKTGWGREEVLAKVRVVVVTLGEKGCHVYRDGKKFESAAVKVRKVVDPTGAGDSFRAGFLYGYSRDWELRKCVQLGAAVASFAVEQHGAQEHKFSKAGVGERYKKTFGKKFKW